MRRESERQDTGGASELGLLGHPTVVFDRVQSISKIVVR